MLIKQVPKSLNLASIVQNAEATMGAQKGRHEDQVGQVMVDVAGGNGAVGDNQTNGNNNNVVINSSNNNNSNTGGGNNSNSNSNNSKVKGSSSGSRMFGVSSAFSMNWKFKGPVDSSVGSLP